MLKRVCSPSLSVVRPTLRGGNGFYSVCRCCSWGGASGLSSWPSMPLERRDYKPSKQPLPDSKSNGSSTAWYAQFVKDVTQMSIDRTRANNECFCYHAISMTICYQTQHLTLPVCKKVERIQNINCVHRLALSG